MQTAVSKGRSVRMLERMRIALGAGCPATLAARVRGLTTKRSKFKKTIVGTAM